MALRNQPYLPLYINDFMADEKLRECNAESTGVYIRLMCLMHKSEEYGVILLKQIDKQNASNIKNFAVKIAKHMPYGAHVIDRSLKQLLAYDVVQMDGDRLFQKRMVRDNHLSEIRAKAGKKGGESSFAKAKMEAKPQANTENEIEYVNEDINTIITYLNNKANTSYRTTGKKTRELIKARFNDKYTVEDFKKVIDNKCAEWIGTEFEKFLRPETLFSNKFEGYLNQKVKPSVGAAQEKKTDWGLKVERL